MKKIFLIWLVFIAGLQLSAQMHISTNLRQDYSWNKTDQKWELASRDETSSTLFDFNKDVTMFKHTTASISSSYFIKGNTHEKDSKVWEYEVVSDVGNKYQVILDTDNNNIRFIGKDKDGNLFLVRHTIKHLWFDE